MKSRQQITEEIISRIDNRDKYIEEMETVKREISSGVLSVKDRAIACRELQDMRVRLCGLNGEIDALRWVES